MERYAAVGRALGVYRGYVRSKVTYVSDQGPGYDPSEYVYVQVADRIAGLIETGVLKPGTRLPGERELAGEYGVAVGTIRRATRRLRDRGLIRTLPAKGTFVLAPGERDPRHAT
jgi:GntR family transcriptional regulator